MYFFCFMGAGIFFLILAFTIALPTIILSPSKFALSFTLGCTSMMMAFASLKGWQQQLQHMFSRERMPFSAGAHCHARQPVICMQMCHVLHASARRKDA